MCRYIFPALFLLSACSAQQDKDRIAQLEQRVKVLEEKSGQQAKLTDLEIQGKCADRAKTYFDDKWSEEKRYPGLQVLEYQNHYNRARGICLISIDFRFLTSKAPGASSNFLSLYNAFDGSELGKFSEHYDLSARTPEEKHSVFDCAVEGVNCQTKEEFEKLSGVLMQN